MCGIYGTTLKYSSETYRKKLKLMNFRGPDHQDFKSYGDNRVTLGHVRLAIMDLDPRSNQPFDYNERYSIVFNGEVYNFLELKRDYLSDVNFRTTSDTEVICAMYEKFGTKAFSYFNGMFAFVIYDKIENKLVGCRDRLGKKPFYYWHSENGLEFASQLNPIKYGNEFHIDAFARQTFLLRSYIVDPYSIYEEVKKLRAGHFFVYDIETNQIQIEQYWDLFTNSCGFVAPKSYEEAKETVKELLFDAVKIRLRADVPIGMFLSGGIDSSLTSAIISKLNKDITAYTIGFNDERYNESSHAVEVAKALNIPIKVNFCEGSDMLNMFYDFEHFFDEPFADPSLIPTSLVASKARNDVTVVVGGDGGDELFYGYSSYFSYLKRQQAYTIAPYCIRRTIYNVEHLFYHSPTTALLQYRNVEESILATSGYAYYYGSDTFDRIALAHSSPDKDFLYNQKRGNLRFSDYDMKVYMNSCINTKTDRATMRSSLELRSPIMDYRLAEYSRLLPFEYLYTPDLGGKRILKDILYEMIPREILERPKQGFGSPIGSWFKNELKDDFIKVLSPDNICLVVPEIDSDLFETLRNDYLKGRKLDAMCFWTLYSYLKWYNSSL